MSRFGFNSRYDSSSSPGISANQPSGSSSGSGMNFWQKLWKWLSGGYYAEHNNGFLAFVKQVGGYATDEEARAALASEHSDTFMSRFFGNPLGAVSEEVSNIFGESGPLSGLGNLISSLASRIAGTNLTGAEREANEFTAQQAQINRSFQSAEAEKAREWQEEQYLKYNSPAAQMQQFRDAGINPIMVAGGNMPSASTSTAAPSGSAGSSVSPSAPVDIISSIISVLKTKAELENIKADTRQKEAGANKTEAETEWMGKLNDLSMRKGEAEIGQINANINLITEKIHNVLSDTNLNNNERKMALAAQSALAFAQKSLAEKQASALNWDIVEKEWTANFIKNFGMSPELAGDLARSIGGALGNVTKLFGRFGR